MTLSMRKISGEADSKPWWLKHPNLRKILFLPLYLTTRDYRRWRNAQLTPKKLRRNLRELDKKFPFKRENLIGRDQEYQLLMTSFSYHVIQDSQVREIFKAAPPPKFFILKGATGTGKSLLAEVCIRDAISYGVSKGVNIQPIIVKGEDVFDPFYGQSIKNLANIFKRAKEAPSIIFFDEFQTFGMKVGKASQGVDREDIRVQDTFVDYINKILNTQQRTVVIVATNIVESIREDIRRRGYFIDLDQNITRDMLLAVLAAELEKNGWTHLKPEEVMDILEKTVSAFRQTQLTPFDIIDACQKIRNRKIEPIRANLFKKIKDKIYSSEVKYTVTLEDFKIAARELRGYVEQEKSSEVMSAILKIKPSTTYNDVGGLFGIKEKIFKTISLSLRTDLASKLNWVPPKGFLLWGEPGCGKTHLSKAIARENNATFFYAPAAHLLMNAKWVGEPEKNVRDLFALARKHAPSIIFFDEFDVLSSKRRGDPVGDKITAQILTELDGLQPLENVIVIAATNKLEAIDEAILNRFEPYIIEIPLPRNDAERMDIIRVHLREYIGHLHPEVSVEKVLSIIKRFRVVSPRVVAEIIREANRLRSQEVIACMELCKAEEAKDEARKKHVMEVFRKDLERLYEVLGTNKIQQLKNVNSETYKIRLYHFEKAAEQLEPEIDKELMDVQESVLHEIPDTGVVVGLATDQQGRRGMILIVECAINSRGTGKITLTGAAKTAVLGHATTVEDLSVLESATNVIEYIRSYIYDKIGLDISNYDFKFQVISPLEGVAGMGVTGPSLGVAFSVAAISELAGVKVEPNIVMTGKGDIKGNVGPIGGVGWRGAGKIQAAIKTRKIKIRKFILPKWNYEKSTDELKTLMEQNIEVIPVQRQVEAWIHALNLSEEEIVRRLAVNLSGFEPKPTFKFNL
ncbi:MAG: hypothetical protein B6U77_00550 [Candidatus Hecatellales archaeon ex4484_218]|nr:MAG: hypothetical protein B6U77_00550 [Candidatus Hecatellales archaeon ex4484_218]